MLIIIFSLIVLALGFGIGWRFPKHNFWEWVDVIYYPLAICGVILLFFESVNTRQVANLEAQKRDAAQRLLQIDAQRPAGEPQMSGRDLVRIGGQILSNISKLDRSCQRTPTTLPVCFVVEDLAPIIKDAESILLSYDGPERLGDVCEVASSTFEAMSGSAALSGFLMDPISDHYFEGLNKGFRSFEFDPVQNYIDSLRPELERKKADMIAALNMNEDDRSRMEPRYDAQIDYGMSVLKAFEACLRAPASIRSGEYASWVSNMDEARSEAEQKEAELQQLRISAGDLNQAAIFRASYWPFLIILALSLKFSKGVAALRKKHVGA